MRRCNRAPGALQITKALADQARLFSGVSLVSRAQVLRPGADKLACGLLTDGEPITRTEVKMKKFWVYRAATTVAAITTLAVASGAANKFAIPVHLFGL